MKEKYNSVPRCVGAGSIFCYLFENGHFPHQHFAIFSKKQTNLYKILYKFLATTTTTVAITTSVAVKIEILLTKY